MVDGVISGENDLGDGDEGIALLQQALDNTGQSFGCVLGSVMKQDDGAGADLGGDSFGDVGCGQVLPV